MKKTHLTKSRILLAIVIPYALALAGSRLNANPFQSSAQSAPDKFSWFGELVTLNEASRIMTVKARVVGDQTPAALAQFKAGDKIMVSWSGYDKSADAINGAARHTAGKKPEGRWAFPVEFVSFDAARQYVTYRAQIPTGSVETVKTLKPGEWVVATSPHQSASETEVIVDVKPYAGSRSGS